MRMNGDAEVDDRGSGRIEQGPILHSEREVHYTDE